MPEVHAKLSASSAYRWMACPGSVQAESGLPDMTSEHADHGTAAHHLAALCLENGKDADHYRGCTIRVPVGQNTQTHFTGAGAPVCEGRIFEVDTEMVDAVQTYLDYCRDLEGVRLIEQRVDYSPWAPEGFGTADFIALRDDVCTVIDFKFGTGVRVNADKNPQAMLYALGAFNEYDFLFDCATFKLAIIQPRIDHVSEWDISKDALLAFGEKVRAGAALALAEKAPRTPGVKACQFCRARGSCKALAEHNYALAVEDFNTIGDDIVLKKTDELTPEEVGQLLTDIEILSGWAGAVKAHAFGIIERGGAVPGYKLVEGRTVRKWTDEAAAGQALIQKLPADVVFRQKVVTITEAEKRLGKKHPLIGAHVTKSRGAPTLAPESSPKPALTFNAGADFEGLNPTT